MISTKLATAIAHARRIRHNLVRLRKDRDLAGDCGLASMLLAQAIDDVNSLRHAVLDGALCIHVFNRVDGVIVDITATQFDDGFDENLANDPALRRGVLVTRTPRFYHTPIGGRGAQTLRMLRDDEWYMDGLLDYRPARMIYERLAT